MARNVGGFCQFAYRVSRRPQGPPINNLQRLSRPPPNEIAIEFQVTECLQIQKFIGDDLRPPSITETVFPTRLTSLEVPIHAALLCDGGACVMSLLSEVGVHVEPPKWVLNDIGLMAAAQTAGTANWPIVVTILHMRVVFLEGDEEEEVWDEMDTVLRESMDVDLVKTTPATRSSIEKLEKVTYEEGLGSIDECIFCTEEFEAGLELTRLPCSHVYHGDCIVRWLEQSHLCPLCRYALPVADLHQQAS